MPNNDPVLDFERFCRRQNNFFLHFVGKPGEEHEVGDIYRNKKGGAYGECLERNPEFGVISSRLRNYSGELLAPEHMGLLYRAYQMMHPHADNNWDMFR